MVEGLVVMESRSKSKNDDANTLLNLLEQIQKLPEAFLKTKEGVAFVSLISGLALEAGGFSELRYRIKTEFRNPEEKFIWNEDKEDGALGIVPFHSGNENTACLSLDKGTRDRICALKPRLNVEFDLWPWTIGKDSLIGKFIIGEDFGKIDLPIAKLLMILGSMGMSAEFVKGVGGVIPG